MVANLGRTEKEKLEKKIKQRRSKKIADLAVCNTSNGQKAQGCGPKAGASLSYATAIQPEAWKKVSLNQSS